MNATPSTPFHILLVEDSPSDALLTKEAFREAKVPVSLHSLRNGQEAMAFLRKKGDYQNSPRPHLILLDWKLPGRDGCEIISDIKSDSDLQTIPVIVLSTSTQDQDILNAYRLRANCYMSKPLDFEAFKKVIHRLWQFWFQTVTLPSQPQSPSSPRGDDSSGSTPC